MKGLSTDDETITLVLSTHSRKQRQQIAEEYKIQQRKVIQKRMLSFLFYILFNMKLEGVSFKCSPSCTSGTVLMLMFILLFIYI